MAVGTSRNNIWVQQLTHPWTYLLGLHAGGAGAACNLQANKGLSTRSPQNLASDLEKKLHYPNFSGGVKCKHSNRICLTLSWQFFVTFLGWFFVTLSKVSRDLQTWGCLRRSRIQWPRWDGRWKHLPRPGPGGSRKHFDMQLAASPLTWGDVFFSGSLGCLNMVIKKMVEKEKITTKIHLKKKHRLKENPSVNLQFEFPTIWSNIYTYIL